MKKCGLYNIPYVAILSLIPQIPYRRTCRLFLMFGFYAQRYNEHLYPVALGQLFPSDNWQNVRSLSPSFGPYPIENPERFNQSTPPSMKYRSLVFCTLDQGLAKYSPKAKTSPKPVFVDKVLLEHHHSLQSIQTMLLLYNAELHNCHRPCGLQSWKCFCYLGSYRKMARPALVIIFIISAHQMGKKGLTVA